MTLILVLHYYIRALCTSNNTRTVHALLMYALFWPLLIALVLLILANRNHYTVDILIALYTTPMVFYTSFKFVPDSIVPVSPPRAVVPPPAVAASVAKTNEK